MNGIKPNPPPATKPDQQPFQNICPQCTTQKLVQRPSTATKVRPSSAIRIRK